MLGVRGDIRAGEAKLTSLTGVAVGARSLTKPDMTSRLVADDVRAKERANIIGASQRAALLTELASSQSRLAKKDAVPEFTPQRLMSRSDGGTTFVGAGLSFPLPIFNQNQSQIAQREAELRAAKVKQDNIEIGSFRRALVSLEQ